MDSLKRLERISKQLRELQQSSHENPLMSFRPPFSSRPTNSFAVNGAWDVGAEFQPRKSKIRVIPEHHRMSRGGVPGNVVDRICETDTVIRRGRQAEPVENRRLLMDEHYVSRVYGKLPHSDHRNARTPNQFDHSVKRRLKIPSKTPAPWRPQIVQQTKGYYRRSNQVQVPSSTTFREFSVDSANAIPLAAPRTFADSSQASVNGIFAGTRTPSLENKSCCSQGARTTSPMRCADAATCTDTANERIMPISVVKRQPRRTSNNRQKERLVKLPSSSVDKDGYMDAAFLERQALIKRLVEEVTRQQAEERRRTHMSRQDHTQFVQPDDTWSESTRPTESESQQSQADMEDPWWSDPKVYAFPGELWRSRGLQRVPDSTGVPGVRELTNRAACRSESLSFAEISRDLDKLAVRFTATATRAGQSLFDSDNGRDEEESDLDCSVHEVRETHAGKSTFKSRSSKLSRVREALSDTSDAIPPANKVDAEEQTSDWLLNVDKSEKHASQQTLPFVPTPRRSSVKKKTAARRSTKTNTDLLNATGRTLPGQQTSFVGLSVDTNTDSLHRLADIAMNTSSSRDPLLAKKEDVGHQTSELRRRSVDFPSVETNTDPPRPGVSVAFDMSHYILSAGREDIEQQTSQVLLETIPAKPIAGWTSAETNTDAAQPVATVALSTADSVYGMLPHTEAQEVMVEKRRKESKQLTVTVSRSSQTVDPQPDFVDSQVRKQALDGRTSLVERKRAAPDQLMVTQRTSRELFEAVVERLNNMHPAQPEPVRSPPVVVKTNAQIQTDRCWKTADAVVMTLEQVNAATETDNVLPVSIEEEEKPKKKPRSKLLHQLSLSSLEDASSSRSSSCSRAFSDGEYIDNPLAREIIFVQSKYLTGEQEAYMEQFCVNQRKCQEFVDCQTELRRSLSVGELLPALYRTYFKDFAFPVESEPSHTDLFSPEDAFVESVSQGSERGQLPGRCKQKGHSGNQVPDILPAIQPESASPV